VFSFDGRTLATGSQDGTVLSWDMTNQTRPRRLGQPLRLNAVCSVAFSPDGRTLATGRLGPNGAVVGSRSAPGASFAERTIARILQTPPHPP
jgi:WD40 repeat protein